VPKRDIHQSLPALGPYGGALYSGGGKPRIGLTMPRAGLPGFQVPPVLVGGALGLWSVAAAASAQTRALPAPCPRFPCRGRNVECRAARSCGLMDRPCFFERPPAAVCWWRSRADPLISAAVPARPAWAMIQLEARASILDSHVAFKRASAMSPTSQFAWRCYPWMDVSLPCLPPTPSPWPQACHLLIDQRAASLSLCAYRSNISRSAVA